jgi:hypothetical protein
VPRDVVAIIALVIGLASPGGAAGQTVSDTGGAIAGRVTDQTAAAMPGVTVVISSAGRMGTTEATTGPDGSYRFTVLPPNQYTLVFSRAGFRTVKYTAVPVSVGVTTPLDAVMIAEFEQEITVSGAGVLDRQSPSHRFSFDTPHLANIPGPRTMNSILSALPAVHLTRPDVGGSAGLIAGPTTTYGTGTTPPTLEGVVIANVNPYGLTLDYGSFQEIAVTTAAHAVDLETAGIRFQFVTKSGGDQYHGSVYADYEDRRWQAVNIDRAQIERAAAADAFLSRDANRLWSYHDVNADVGGYIARDRAWWYASVRGQAVSSRLVAFPVKPFRTEARNVSLKGDARLSPNQRLILFGNVARTNVPNFLDGFGAAGGALAATTINLSEESTSQRASSGSVVKAEWQWMRNAMFASVRVGRFAPRRDERPHGGGPRFENGSTGVVSGGNRTWEATLSRPQLQASASYFKDGWYGSHQVKAGLQILRSTESQYWKQAYPGDVLHVLRDNFFGPSQPSEVYLFATPSRSESGLSWSSAYIGDAWEPHGRLTLNAGVRFDRFGSFLPEQTNPPGDVTPRTVTFPEVNPLIEWNVFSPRLSVTYALTKDSKTLAKASYGVYPTVPSPELGFNANPNSNQPWTRYRWEDDNGDGFWQPGEQKATLATSGREAIDPELKLPFTREATLDVERELRGGVALRSGLVWRGLRQPYLRQNDSQPWSAYSLATVFGDPGPDNEAGTADDGRDITAYALPSGLPPASHVVRNVPGARTDHWTWEITAVRRFRRPWSLLAGFANTWSRDHATGYAGQAVRQNTYPLTPNDLINTGDDGRHEFSVWSVKIHGTYHAPWDVRITPFLRHQSGQPFGRTLAVSLSGINRILVEPIGTRRMDHVTILDLRVEKGFEVNSLGRAAVFFDAYNLLNANPEQNISWVTGQDFRPLTIVPPRIARIGVRLDW